MTKQFLQALSLLLVISVIGISSFYALRDSGDGKAYAKTATVRIDKNTYYAVSDVLDGDTFKVDIGGKDITVRMLGIDTPETVDPRKPIQCYGKEASDETKRLLSSQSVRLKLNPKREVLDKYGRYLAYVYLADGVFLNEYLIENGFAREYTYGKPYSQQRNFKKDEMEAKEKRVGLWKECKY